MGCVDVFIELAGRMIENLRGADYSAYFCRRGRRVVGGDAGASIAAATDAFCL
jgi:hypothetical protein